MNGELSACNGKVQKGRDGAPDYRYLELKFQVPVTEDSVALVGLVGTSMQVVVTERQATFGEVLGDAIGTARDALADAGASITDVQRLPEEEPPGE